MQIKQLDALLQDHCQDQRKHNGLLLLTLPTGFGKTHYVLEYMATHLRQGFTQPIWFITNLKKNLPLETFKEKVGPEAFNQHVLFLNSNSGQVSEFLAREDISPNLQTQLRTYDALKKAAEALWRPPAHLEFRQYLQRELDEKERAFRKELKAYLKTRLSGKSIEERLQQLRSMPDLRWVERMYPAVQFTEKRIYFCTIDKFYRSVDTIIGHNLQIANAPQLANSLVFIDEFDASKGPVKRAIIDNAVRFNQDILGLFTQIYYGLQNRFLPVERIGRASRSRIQYLNQKFGALTEEAARIYERYQFQSHYFHRGNNENDRIFLFHDLEYHTIFEGGGKNGKPRFLTRQFHEADQTNYIRLEQDQPDRPEESLLHLLNDLRSLIHLFTYFISDFSQTYKEVHDKERTEEISIENAIRTALDLFDLRDGRTQQYIIDTISQRVFNHEHSSNASLDASPLHQGFRYYDILNRKNHDATSKILYADTISTPESWLINLCRRAKVIGISATAGFDSPISNYSLEHVRHHLQDHYYELSADDLAHLRKEFREKNKYAEQRDIQTIAIGCASKEEHALGELFPERETIREFQYLFSDLKAYELQRYVKLGKAYLYFIQHPGINSFLCLLNKFPKPSIQDRFNQQDLNTLLVQLRISHLGEDAETAQQAVTTELRILNSEDFEAQLEEIHAQLTQGERIFLISTYPTMGAGLNIQYLAPENVPVVAINDLPYGGNKKDFDGLYLEKPTYLLHFFQTGESINDVQLLDYLFEVEYLAEGGAITRQEKNERIRYIFRRRYNDFAISPSNRPLYERQVVAEHFCRMLIQAVGRLSRTRLKAPTTHILYDAAISEYLQYFHRGNHLLVPEFDALLEHCRASKNVLIYDQIEIQNRNYQNSLSFAALLRKLVLGIPDWKTDTIKFWEGLREFTLKNPTISRERLQQSGALKFYIAHPDGLAIDQYHYSSKDDFKNDLDIYFDQSVGKAISAEAALLPQLMQIPVIEALFREKHYCAGFAPDEYILSPPLFQNIYLGALGEVIGSRILQEYGLNCRPLEAGEYELFDAKLSDDIYLDFKFWGTHTRVAAESQLTKIKAKMDQVGARKVLIINIVHPGAGYQPIAGQDGIIEVPGLLDLEQGQIIPSALKFIHQKISAHV